MLEVNEFRCCEAKIEVGGHLTVVAQWQSTGGSSQRCPGLDSRRLPAFSLLYFRHIKSKFIVRQDTLSTKHLYRVQQMEEYKANSIVLLSCHVNWKTHELSLTYVPFPGLVATSIVAVLQAPDGKGS